ncbi:MAG: 3-isopropylmalate dehydratase small subunit [Gracilibacteraceae bacterium]|jgi:3-isopropylmalate/(R)-2-methylmalate dehydratase small subunit|nr:3-isopropylmalate dehydratase small subunit [Gracilibacteraceae bacterium]
MAVVKGNIWKFGDSVDTDQIIPARYLNIPDPDELKKHCFADARPDFAAGVRAGDVIVGGGNFGCGSSREEAPSLLKENGIAAVLAGSFGRIFLRNAVNIGLIAVECPGLDQEVSDGDQLEMDTDTGEIHDLTNNKVFHSQPLPKFLQEIIKAGGLLPYAQAELQA